MLNKIIFILIALSFLLPGVVHANALRDYWSVTDLKELGDLIVMDELFDDDMFDNHGIMDMIQTKLWTQNTPFSCGNLMSRKCPATELMILENFYSQ